MDKNITATMTDAEKEFANAIADGMNTAFKKADMQNNLAIGISSAAAVGGVSPDPDGAETPKPVEVVRLYAHVSISVVGENSVDHS